jgi:hypothetical protein
MVLIAAMLISQGSGPEINPRRILNRKVASRRDNAGGAVMEAEMMRTLNPGLLAGCVCTPSCVLRRTARSRDVSIKLSPRHA